MGPGIPVCSIPGAFNAKETDHAMRFADRCRDKVEAFDHVELKLAYFQGVLDWASMQASGDLWVSAV